MTAWCGDRGGSIGRCWGHGGTVTWSHGAVPRYLYGKRVEGTAFVLFGVMVDDERKSIPQSLRRVAVSLALSPALSPTLALSLSPSLSW